MCIRDSESTGRTTSEVLSEIHSRVHARHLVAVSVEHQCLALEELTEAPFRRLAPPRMVHLRVDVGIEAVLARALSLPGAHRLPVHEANAHDGLDSLEPVLPVSYTHLRAHET